MSIFARGTPWTSRRSSRAVRAHDDEALGERVELVHHAPLMRIRRGEDRVQRRHDRHAQLAEQRQDVAARLAAEDPVLVLDATRRRRR